MTTITTYVPKRDRLGKFRAIQFRKLAWTIIKKELIILNILTSLYFAHQLYNVRCEVNGKVVGYFTTKQTCGDIAASQLDSEELARQQMMATNQDLFNK